MPTGQEYGQSEDSTTNSDGRHTTHVTEPSGVDRRAYLKSGATALTGSAILSGCLTGGGGGGALKVGAVFPMSGSYATLGEGIEEGYRMAIEEFDGEVNGREIELLVRDSETSTNAAVPRVNDLMNQENVELLVGGLSSSVVLATQQAVESTQIPYFAVGGSSLRANAENCSRYSFLPYPSGWQYSGGALAAHEAGVMDSLFFVQADYAAGEGVYQGVTSVLESESDVDLRGRELVPLGADDYSGAISAARESGAGTVWATLTGSDAIRFTQQAESSGLIDEVNVMFGAVTNSLAQAIDESILEKLYGGSAFYFTAEGSQDFGQRYIDRAGGPPEWWAAVAYDGMMEGLTAIQETGSTNGDGVVDFLEGREFSWSRAGTSWRECDHRAVLQYHFLKGLPTSERSTENEYWDVLATSGGEQVMRSCSETGCEL